MTVLEAKVNYNYYKNKSPIIYVSKRRFWMQVFVEFPLFVDPSMT